MFTQLYLENNTKRKTIGLYHECDHSKNLPSWNVTAKTKRAATRTRNPLLAILIYFVFKYISLGLELRRRIQIGTLLTFRRIEIYAFNSIISGVVVFCVVRWTTIEGTQISWIWFYFSILHLWSKLLTFREEIEGNGTLNFSRFFSTIRKDQLTEWALSKRLYWFYYYFFLYSNRSNGRRQHVRTVS